MRDKSNKRPPTKDAFFFEKNELVVILVLRDLRQSGTLSKENLHESVTTMWEVS